MKGIDKAWSFALHSVARPLWMDVPSAEAPAFAGMTVVMTVMTVVLHRAPIGHGALKPMPTT